MNLLFNQEITLDLTVSRIQNIHCSEDDKDSRNILIQLTDKGKPYILTNDVSVFLKISKPDGKFIYIDEDDSDHLYRNNNGTISIILSEQITTVSGICEAEIQLIKESENRVISTTKFNIIVKKSVLNDTDIESSIDSNIIKKMISHLIDITNPHKVTKTQVGLGDVPNVSTNNQTPTYNEAEKLENISSGEKISVAFGKIKKAIGTFISHISTKATATQEGHVKLTDSITSDSVNTAATPNSIKMLNTKFDEENKTTRNLLNEKADLSHTHTKSEITDFPALGTASSKDIASTGNASATQVVMGNDTRLTDARKASDVSAWAKANTKPSYTKSEVGLANVDNTSDISKPVSTAQQTAIDAAYANSNKYTDQKIADLIGGAPETMDTLKEVHDAIEENKNVEKALNAAIGTKANQSELDTHTGNTTIHITASERKNWNAAKTHADSAHARTDATKVEKSDTNGNIKINGTETNVYTHPSGTNPHGTTKSDVGLGNVDNTADVDKSVKYATSSGSSTKSTGVVDYGSTTKTIQIGYGGDGISGDNIKYIAGYTSGNGSDVNAKIKDVSKDALKSWLGLGSLAYSSATIPTSLPANGGNSATVNGHTVNSNVPANAKFTDTTYNDATTTSSGLMSASDKITIENLKNGGVTGIKGNAETKYRTGNVNITAEDIGAIWKFKKRLNNRGGSINLPLSDYVSEIMLIVHLDDEKGAVIQSSAIIPVNGYYGETNPMPYKCCVMQDGYIDLHFGSYIGIVNNYYMYYVDVLVKNSR